MIKGFILKTLRISYYCISSFTSFCNVFKTFNFILILFSVVQGTPLITAFADGFTLIKYVNIIIIIIIIISSIIIITCTYN